MTREGTSSLGTNYADSGERKGASLPGLPRWAAVVLVLAAFQVLWTAQPAHAAETASQRLVRNYAPILQLREQEDPPCDTNEEQYQPTWVNIVLGNPRVTLVKAGRRSHRRITTAPTEADIAGLGHDYYLDLPGDPILSGCKYAKDFAALKKAGKAPAITYARIAREKGKPGLVVQYWFFYYFNQFNDVHEADWEGMQIAFDEAETPEQAGVIGPSRIAVFQHSGAETASWYDGKVQKRENHPIVYPAAGSHATFFSDAVYVENGQNGSGLGCDNTTKPLRELHVRPVLMPTEPVKGGPFQWVTYEGHWGGKEKGFNNGITGPITKGQWLKPFTWMDGARLASPKLPGGGFLGPAATPVFCGAVAIVSQFINAQAKSPTGVLVLVAILLLIVLLPLLLTRWWPVELSPLRQRRAFGQLVRAARQVYGRHWRIFVPIGLSAIVIIGSIEAFQALYTEIVGRRAINPSISFGRNAQAQLSITISGTLRPLGFALVGAAAVAAVRLIQREDPVRFTAAWGRTLRRFWRLLFAQIGATVMVFLMVLTVIGIPFAIWKFIGWQLVQQQIIFEDKSLREAFRGSSQLVRGRWWRTLRVAGFLWLLSVAIGPVLGFVLIFSNFSLIWVNVVSSVIYALLVPYVAIGKTLLYFDLSVRKEEEAQAATAPRRGLRRWFRSRPSPQPG